MQSTKFKGLACTVDEAALVDTALSKMPAETRAVLDRLLEGGDEAMHILLVIQKQNEEHAQKERPQ